MLMDRHCIFASPYPSLFTLLSSGIRMESMAKSEKDLLISAYFSQNIFYGL